MIKTQSDKNETPGPSNFAKIQQQSSKITVTQFKGSYFKVARLGRP